MNKQTEKLKLILSVLFVLTTIYVFSQGNFKKAYIVNNSNDTTYGFVDHANPIDITQKCVFRNDSNSQIVDYKPTDLKSFCFEKGKLYMSKDVKYNDNSTTLFLEFLLKGIVNLYYCRYNGEDVFYIEKDSILMELTNGEEKIRINEKVYFYNSKKYIGILKALLIDAESLSDKIESTDFDFTSLIKLLKQYHNEVCDSESCIVYYKKENKLNDVKWKLNFGLTLEYSIAKMDVSSEMINGVKYYSYQQDISHSYLAKFNMYKIAETNSNFTSIYNCLFPVAFVNFSRNSGSSFQLELNYKYLNYELFGISRIEIPVIYSYEFLHYKKLTPYINAGVSNVITFGAKVKNMYYKYDRLEGATFENNIITPLYSEQSDIINRKIPELNGYHFALNAGCGIEYDLTKKNAVRLEVRGQTPVYSIFKGVLAGGPNYESLVTLSNFSVLFSYVFK